VNLRDFYGRHGWPLMLDSDDFVVFERRGALFALFGADHLGRDHTMPERGRWSSDPEGDIAVDADVPHLVFARSCG
jgi:hypothetical protein